MQPAHGVLVQDAHHGGFAMRKQPPHLIRTWTCRVVVEPHGTFLIPSFQLLSVNAELANPNPSASRFNSVWLTSCKDSSPPCAIGSLKSRILFDFA